MTPQQHAEMAALMNSLNDIQIRMARVKHIFPSHYSQLLQSYNQILAEAKRQRLLPPWMVG
ncbi:MAG: hypothetical protein IT223_03035 [Crocinitomicaceae bacterium]|nr:hypothetical protein [Crocinitomicaceae bacterium]